MHEISVLDTYENANGWRINDKQAIIPTLKSLLWENKKKELIHY